MPRYDRTGPGEMVDSASSLGKGQGGHGRKGGPASAGPGGNCVCPKCGHTESHFRGQPCNQKQCPECGTSMTRNQ